MAFWFKKKIVDTVIKYFNDKKVTIEKKNDIITFELLFENKGYSLYPYIKINEDTEEFSIVINIRKYTDDLYFDTINEFF